MRIAEKKKSQITALYEQCSNLPADVRSCLENGYFTVTVPPPWNILQFPNCSADSVHALFIDGGKPFEGVIPVVRQGKHLRQQALGLQRQIFIAKMMIAHNGIVLNALYAKNSHFTNPFM